jgi:glutathione synthase/RimK-type ligase-like ATP-grasp enzyme
LDTRVGLLVGLENSFPAPFLEAVNSKGERHGITAEMAVLGKVAEVEDPPRYKVIVDRISHEVPFYRAFLKSAVLQGAAVINDPFWWEADEKFFECTLARHIGVAVPRTVVLPNKEYIPGIDPEKSLRNMQYPLDWEAIVAYTGFPAVLKPNTGGGWRDVFIVRNMDELLRDYDQTGTKTMILQEFIDWEDYVRCVVIGGEVLVFRYAPNKSFFERYVTDDPPSGWLKDRAAEDALKLAAALGYDMDTVEFAVRDGVLYAIDFLNPAPDFDNFSIKEEGFAWVIDKMSDLVLAYAQDERNPPWHGAHRWYDHIAGSSGGAST